MAQRKAWRCRTNITAHFSLLYFNLPFFLLEHDSNLTANLIEVILGMMYLLNIKGALWYFVSRIEITERWDTVNKFCTWIFSRWSCAFLSGVVCCVFLSNVFQSKLRVQYTFRTIIYMISSNWLNWLMVLE